MISKMNRIFNSQKRTKLYLVAGTIILLLTFFVFHNGSGALSQRSGLVTIPDEKIRPHKKVSASYLLKKNNPPKNEEREKLLSEEDKLKLKFIDRNRPEDPVGKQLQLARDFYKHAFAILRLGKPDIPPLDKYASEERIYHAGYESMDEGPPLTLEYLKQFLQLTDDEIESMKKSHNTVTRDLPNHLPPGLYKGNGIVYVGGGKFNWLTLLSIKTLRGLGSHLPVEVFIPSLEEYELELCSKVFPALNAKCVYLPRVLGEEIMDQFTFEGYQYKSLALILSSFENVLLLDADNIPTKAPDFLFHSDPFKSHGLIVWPDFWKRATSPYFYDIVDIALDEKFRASYGFSEYGDQVIPNSPEDLGIPLHQLKGAIPDPSSESGQIMFSKAKHIKTMYLALYYNLYGPEYFYRLFSQGSDGEGDKETFIAAAVVLRKPFYQVKKFVKSLGRYMDDEYVGAAMGQYDPVDDYNIWRRNLETSGEVFEVPDVLFIHSNVPKLDPWAISLEQKITDERVRLYGPGLIDVLNFDFELLQWRNMKFFLCDLKIHFKAFDTYKITNDELCAEISAQLNFLLLTTKTV